MAVSHTLGHRQGRAASVYGRWMDIGMELEKDEEEENNVEGMNVFG